MSKLFSFRYNSSSSRLGLMPWHFQNIMFVPMKANIRCLSLFKCGRCLVRIVLKILFCFEAYPVAVL